MISISKSPTLILDCKRAPLAYTPLPNPITVLLQKLSQNCQETFYAVNYFLNGPEDVRSAYYPKKVEQLSMYEQWIRRQKENS